MPATLALHRHELHRAYAEGVAVETVLRQAYRRLAELDDPGIFIHLAPLETVLAEAARLPAFDPATMPLWGLPFAVKDNIDVAGMPTTAGCPAYAYMPERDAHVVARLRAAGAIPIGKTNLDQFATGLVGTRTPYPVPRNALDPSLVPGGSSSGSAVAVAQGLVSFALGTDTAGSGRVPAALNNIVGLKPSLGLLSNTGVVPACRTLDTVSIFALATDDAVAAFRICSDRDYSDPFARSLPAVPFAAPASGFRVGVPDAASLEFFGDQIQADAFSEALGLIEAEGGKLVKLDFSPLFEVARMLYEGAWVAERLSVIETLLKEQPDAVHPVTRSIIGGAAELSAVDAFRGIYRLAELKRRAEPVLAGVDLLAVPTMPTFYTVEDLAADPIGPNARLGTYTNFVNLMDMAGIAVPTPARADGKPGSVTLLAPAGADGMIAGLAAAVHARAAVTLGATGWTLPPWRQPTPPLAEHELALAVVGAHMSGLPLNSELTRRGGRLLRATATAPIYRLYALEGGPPERPGLVRTGAEGAAIALEVWALPIARLGEILQATPQPLGLGTIELADGSKVNGYLAEPAGVTDALDITGHGGWRAYLETLT